MEALSVNASGVEPDFIFGDTLFCKFVAGGHRRHVHCVHLIVVPGQAFPHNLFHKQITGEMACILGQGRMIGSVKRDVQYAGDGQCGQSNWSGGC